ncbi:ras-associating and dilute domain-containing protein isoform X3 [Hydra vulgaris]|uniref:Ras-associating and dilute domain-containing protein isoform X3 n=2 Tax=Hydra vulgaris TaxID=6087 RepID=A0ABM4CD14_HYDVU
MDDDLQPRKRDRTKSWKEYDGNEEIPMILSEGFLPIKFHNGELSELDYEGAVRFYYDDGKSELTKAVRLTNRTSVEELIPILISKFSLPSNKNYSLYEKDNESDETVLLLSEECPLARAISNKKIPRFILCENNSNISVKPEDSVSQYSSSKEEKKKKLFGKDKIENKVKKTDDPLVKKKKKSKTVPSFEITPLNTESSFDTDEITESAKSDISDTSVDWDKENVLNEKMLVSVNNTKNLKSSLSTASEVNLNTSSKNKGSSEFIESSLNENKHKSLSFSSSSIFYDQDNDENNNPRSLQKVKKQSVTTRTQHPRSISKMFHKKKKDLQYNNTELSTNRLTPGILKVFGNNISAGLNYKAVRVSTISSAQEVIQMALERYAFENADPKDFVLCDVVGTFQSTNASYNTKQQNRPKKGEEDEQTIWNTEYIRIVNENEKPLVLQSLWKPTGNRFRRFELRRKQDVESSSFINTAEGLGRSSSDLSLFESSETSSASKSIDSGAKELPPVPFSPHSKCNGTHSENVVAPLYVPYLLLMQGFRNSSDKLLHKIDDPTIIVGPFSEGGIKYHIELFSSDILEPHAYLYKKLNSSTNSDETSVDDISFSIFVDPAKGAEVSINGEVITSETLLNPGSILGFGKSYYFLFKDPTQQDTGLPWLKLLKPNSTQPSNANYATINHVTKSIQTTNQVFTSDEKDSTENESSSDSSSEEEEIQYLAPRKEVEKSYLQMSYDIKNEDEVLNMILDIADSDLGAFKLTPMYFFMMVIEHSAATFTELQTRKLLLKISSGLQRIAWEKTKEIGKKNIKDEDPLVLLKCLLPELKPVLFWMSSAIEMLNFLQGKMSSYLLPRTMVTTNKEALLSADDELLTVLEEVIMFTFQQTVYHVTKVLYATLPSVIDSNPFRSNDSSDIANDKMESNVHPSVEKITIIFSKVLEVAKEFQVHTQITQQLFAYLFFFSNASLFNTLMEKGTGGKFYQWAKGVQMRTNLEYLESWAQFNGLIAQFDKYMIKIINAVDLLACSIVELTQMDWTSLRERFPSLNAAQLHQLLAEYNLGGKPRPRLWYPPPHEIEPALRSPDVLESFATHPPLMLPSDGFVMDLSKDPDSEDFFIFYDLFRNGGFKNKENESFRKGPVNSKKERTKSHINGIEVKEALKNQPVETSADNRRRSITVNEKMTENDSKISGEFQLNKNTVKYSSDINSVRNKASNPTSSSQVLGNYYNADGFHNVENTDELVNKARNLLESEKKVANNKNEYSVELVRGAKGLGLGLIDAMFTALQTNAIYIRTIVPDTPASRDPRLSIGDRLLGVNGISLVGCDYNQAMDIIKKAGDRLSFLISKSDKETVNKILSSAT